MKRIINGLMMAMALIVINGSMAGAMDGADGLTISGFVDTAYYNESDSETSSFSLDQFEIDIEKKIDNVGGLRFDLQVLPGNESGDDYMEQGFIWADLGGVTLTFGKFNAPIGFELLDPNDMYQYSHAMVFDYGLPTNLIGVKISGEAGMIDYALYAVNGWDNNGDDNTDKTFGARLGVTPTEGVNVGLSYITGPEGEGDDPPTLSVIDVDMTVTAVENLTIGGEINIGTSEGASLANPGDDATWLGYLAMVNYAFTDSAAITLRYDAFVDEEGFVFGAGEEETRYAITVSPSYAIGDGFGVLAEYRLTTSDLEVFADADGKAKDSIGEFAVEFTYSF